MEKHITDERTGLKYELVGDYYLIAGDDEQATDMFFRLVKELAEKEGMGQKPCRRFLFIHETNTLCVVLYWPSFCLIICITRYHILSESLPTK